MEPSDATGPRFIDELLVIIDEEKFRDPFFDAVRKGAIDRDAVKLWVLQASLFVRQFTRFISAIHSNCPYRDAQQLLVENLWEEHGKGASDRDHYALIAKLARRLGATDQEIDDVGPLTETAAYIDRCLTVTREQSFVASMAAIALGIEVFIPAFFRILAESLCANYGLTQDDVEYLLVHVSEDEAHSRRAMELIERYASTNEIKESARRELREMLRVKRRFAEAVYRHCYDAGQSRITEYHYTHNRARIDKEPGSGKQSPRLKPAAREEKQ